MWTVRLAVFFLKIKRNAVTSFWYANAEIVLQANHAPVKDVIFKVDTGARVTTVPYQLLIKNGISEDKILEATKARLTVADGRRIPNSYILRIAEIHVLGKNFRNFEIVTSLSANMGFLLGQNILECFDWDICYSTGIATAVFRKDFMPQSVSYLSKAIDDIEYESPNITPP
jgi:hypothetical protein